MTNPLKYTCLFGGGAIRGMAYIGTIRALEELGIEYDIILQYYVKRYKLDKIAINLNYSVDNIKKLKAKIIKRYS